MTLYCHQLTFVLAIMNEMALRHLLPMHQNLSGTVTGVTSTMTNINPMRFTSVLHSGFVSCTSNQTTTLTTIGHVKSLTARPYAFKPMDAEPIRLLRL